MKKLFFLAFFSVVLIGLNAANEVKSETNTKVNTETSVQNTFVINGLVIDSATNETLAGAVIMVNGQKIYSDLDGNFEIKNVKGEKVKVTVSMISYADQVVEINPNNVNTLNVKLKQI
ncbi:MAG: carboxypeptidase-like regulatory domain-containing protein [Paludibacteraceae bacterium]